VDQKAAAVVISFFDRRQRAVRSSQTDSALVAFGPVWVRNWHQGGPEGMGKIVPEGEWHGSDIGRD
jgi:hypothetical protein